ncbi:DUF3592 domain-containing protein [Desulfopila sp. IMCC35008]|uniref:DUF3592 domain-containing protein n=1 Tax=Desulfopila sp. IMCC35008 TaxID=2653858 RepID=UPI0013D3E00A
MEKVLIYTLLCLPEILLTIGIYTFIRRIFFIRNSIKTLGEISGVQEHKISSTRGTQRTVYYSDVHFNDESGGRHKCIVGFANRFLSRRVGDKVPIVYDKNKPQRSFLNYRFMVWITPVSILVVGILSLYLKYK